MNEDFYIKNVERKTFPLDLLEKQNLKRFDTPGGRVYQIPHPAAVLQDPKNPDYIVLYPSVTTVIGKYFEDSKSYLDEWKERVGLKEANAVTRTAASKGTTIHKMAEQYLLGEEYWKGQKSLNIIEFNKLVPILNAHVNKVYGIELPLYSHELHTAGTADLFCLWDGEPAIVDFKTSRQHKTWADIPHYLAQATAYAWMLDEIYHLTPRKISIIILVENEDRPLVFVEDSQTCVPLMKEIFSYEDDRSTHNYGRLGC